MPNRRQGSQVDSAAAGCRPDGPFGRYWAVRGDSSGAVYFGVGVTGEFGVFARAGDSDEHRIRWVARAERAAADETGHVVRGRSAMPPIRWLPEMSWPACDVAFRGARDRALGAPPISALRTPIPAQPDRKHRENRTTPETLCDAENLGGRGVARLRSAYPAT